MSRGYDDDRDDYEDDRDEAPEPRERGNSDDAVRARTNLPAIFLILIGIFNLLGCFGCLFVAITTATTSLEEFEARQKAAEQMMPQLKNLQEEAKKQGQAVSYADQKRQGVIMYSIGAVINLIGAILPILGGIAMFRLSGYGLAMAGAVVAAIPCLSVASCPCLFGLGLGIWAISVLVNPEVKSAFR
jgi:hypothetical protein